MNFHERHEAIDGLMTGYKAEAQDIADRCWTDGAHWREQDRQSMYAGALQGRMRMLLEDISISAPHLFDELLARMRQRRAA